MDEGTAVDVLHCEFRKIFHTVSHGIITDELMMSEADK